MFLRKPSKKIVAAALIWFVTQGGAPAQTRVRPSGFNLFSVQQDVEIGKQSAQEVEKELPILNDRQVDRYVTRIGNRLKEYAPGAGYPYEFSVVNASEINAFALPGGPVYINRGLIEAARTEDELAGVIAHEISHVGLRHGTNQASKAYLGQAGLSLFGAILGERGALDDVVKIAGGFGLNSLFLKYSRDAETQADVGGVQMLAKAGYNPQAMADFFEVLREQAGRDPGKLENFFSSHPAPVNRSERIQREIGQMQSYPRPGPVGDIDRIHRRLSALPKPPPPRKEGASNAPAGDSGDSRPDIRAIEAPSRTFRAYASPRGLYAIRFPENWSVTEGNDDSLQAAPPGGVVQTQDRTEVIYGFFIGRVQLARANQPRNRDEMASPEILEPVARAIGDATVRNNGYLARDSTSPRTLYLDGLPAIAESFSGRSPVTGEEENAVLMTRFLTSGDAMTLTFVFPGEVYRSHAELIARIASSLRVEDR